jgi:hypothetical protein
MGWVVSVTPRPRGKDRYPLYMRLGGPQSRSGHRGQRKNPLPLPGFEPRSPGRPVRSQTLYWLVWLGTYPYFVTYAYVTRSFILSFTGAYSPRLTFGLPFWGILITHIQTHDMTPLDEWSACRRDLCLHRTTQQTNIHAPTGIRTRDPSNQAAADLRLRPRGRWDRLLCNTDVMLFAFYRLLFA